MSQPPSPSSSSLPIEALARPGPALPRDRPLRVLVDGQRAVPNDAPTAS